MDIFKKFFLFSRTNKKINFEMTDGNKDEFKIYENLKV